VFRSNVTFAVGPQRSRSIVGSSPATRARRVGMRRFTRLTNAFSKKVENHAHAVSLHFAHYNLCRPHQTLSGKGVGPVTPAMAAGVETHPWSVFQLAELLD
jgi:hypothetical protein